MKLNALLHVLCDQLFPDLRSANAIVIPSLREAFGMAAAEAMLLGVPVALTRVDGFVELVGDSEGALVTAAGDPTSLAGAIWQLKSDPDLRRRAAERGWRGISKCPQHLEMGAAVRSRKLADPMPELG